ncbi:MAG: DUF3461 family protein [Granulosicoccus sp.]
MSASINKKTDFFPALEEMGVTRAHQISSYTLRHEGADKDVLKIRYKRAKGSLLPDSRTYKFGRSLKTVIADGGTSRMEHTYEISPFLLKAVAELDSLVTSNQETDNTKTSRIGKERVAELLKEFDELESLANSQTPDTAAVAARFSRLKAQIAAL